jgi:hypothetical protein
MSDSGIVIPSDISDIISERVTVWEKFDEAQGQVAEMEKLSSQITVSNAAQIPAELTTDNTPPAEVAAAYRNFQAEMARIAKAQEGIKTYQAEIKKIEGQRTTMMILIGLGVVVLLGIMACGGFVVLNAILSSLQR